jgi:hypothetical protein
MLSDPPAPDVIEVSIFGPGKGESVLVHLGDNKWIIVDSCIDQDDRSLPALAYLDRIGVDAAKNVLMVLATHAHDDHIAGIAEVFARCESAFFACSSAMTSEEFLALIEVDARVYAGTRIRAFSEYNRVLNIVQTRSGSRPGFRPLKYALEHRPMLGFDGASPTEVTALSPSDEAFRRSLLAWKSLLPVAGDKRRLTRLDPNELAVALWVKAADKAMLLGADLTVGPDGCGWIAVLKNFSPDFKASIFKVPHHGSVTAHHEGIWQDLLANSPIALMTPFRSGSVTLPGREDRDRLCSRTPNTYITAAVRREGASPVLRRKNAALGNLPKQLSDPWGKAGHVRARSRTGEAAWTVTYSAPARPLCSRGK